MSDVDERRSILSHGERTVARELRAGKSPEEIAAARDTSVEAVEKSIDRIETKTHRAVATLLQSPITDRAFEQLESSQRASLRELLDEE